MGAVDLILVGPDIKMRANHGVAARMREQGTSIITIGDASGWVQPSLRLRINRTSGQVYNVVTVSWLLVK